MESEIKLSESEIKLIQLNREKEEAKKKEEELKKAIEREKEIIAKKKEIEKFIDENKIYQAAVHNYLAELNVLDNRFILETRNTSRTFECYDYNYKDHNKPGEYKAEKEVYFTQDVPYKAYTIKHTAGGTEFELEVKDHHITKGGRSHFGRSVSVGYKLFFRYGNDSHKALIARTIVTKIKDKLDTIERATKAAEIKGTAKELALWSLTKQYPEAEITHDSKYNSPYRSSTGRVISEGYNTDFFKVKFKNGLEFKFTYDLMNAGSLRLVYYGMNGIDNSNINKVIDALKGI